MSSKDQRQIRPAFAQAKDRLGRYWRQFEGDLLYHYTKLADRTATYHVQGTANWQAAQQTQKPIIWALWHQQVMPFLMYADRFHDSSTFAMVVVGDKRGDILGRMAERFKAQPHYVDMQGNPVASGRAVVQVIKALKGGMQSFIAPDGPDGPAFEPKRGVTFIARKVGAVIIPIGLWTRQAYQMPRWDRYLVPLPSAQLYVNIGAPIVATKQGDESELELQVSAALDAARLAAQHACNAAQQ